MRTGRPLACSLSRFPVSISAGTLQAQPFFEMVNSTFHLKLKCRWRRSRKISRMHPVSAPIRPVPRSSNPAASAPVQNMASMASSMRAGRFSPVAIAAQSANRGRCSQRAPFVHSAHRVDRLRMSCAQSKRLICSFDRDNCAVMSIAKSSSRSVGKNGVAFKRAPPFDLSNMIEEIGACSKEELSLT